MATVHSVSDLDKTGQLTFSLFANDKVFLSISYKLKLNNISEGTIVIFIVHSLSQVQLFMTP